ncbi:cobalamin biosynthesis protein [Asaia lannensis]|uniref:Cobalamin biosynthesis protein n=1 Tax=Asaia lannensis NBRC 102526 TaxID=1307926 RepID=A0ABT1CI59_9PROT|nr:cobalamin biosynthesis protein [Asaia lannensis]MCO6160545.1 cobalamin biosynthesis protein [Asaia lannensis NBRC 102526]GBQ95209.1 cobalamin biosynthesis protein CbiG [Asaia lannensis NBRC 102526]
MIMGGLGCRLEASPEAMIDVVSRAIDQWGLPQGFAVPPFRQNHAAVQAVARVFSLPVTVVDLLALASAQPRCLTHSERARVTMGFGSIAEGCALAILGPQSQLLGARLAGEGVTCAFAMIGNAQPNGQASGNPSQNSSGSSIGHSTGYAGV